VGLIATGARADEIDIYRNSVGAGGGPARVMFALDLRAEAADVICQDVVAAGCRAVLGEEVYAALDPFGLTKGAGGQLFPVRSGDGVADRLQQSPGGMAASLAESYWPGVTVDRYEVLRAALRVVLERLGEVLRKPSANRRVEVGLMAMHAGDCAGAGPQFAPDFSREPPRACSQGAYVLKGFADIARPAELDKLFVALAALPDPGRRAPWKAAPWSGQDRKSTRLNSSHDQISYAVFCLKKKNQMEYERCTCKQWIGNTEVVE